LDVIGTGISEVGIKSILSGCCKKLKVVLYADRLNTEIERLFQQRNILYSSNSDIITTINYNIFAGVEVEWDKL